MQGSHGSSNWSNAHVGESCIQGSASELQVYISHNCWEPGDMHAWLLSTPAGLAYRPQVAVLDADTQGSC